MLPHSHCCIWWTHWTLTYGPIGYFSSNPRIFIRILPFLYLSVDQRYLSISLLRLTLESHLILKHFKLFTIYNVQVTWNKDIRCALSAQRLSNWIFAGNIKTCRSESLRLEQYDCMNFEVSLKQVSKYSSAVQGNSTCPRTEDSQSCQYLACWNSKSYSNVLEFLDLMFILLKRILKEVGL